MTDVQENPRSHHSYASHLKRVACDIRIFLIWILFTSIFSITLYFYFFNHTSSSLNIWLISIVLFISISFLIVTCILHKFKTRYLTHYHHFFLSLCLILGCFLSVAIFIFNYEIGHLSDPITKPFYTFLFPCILLSFNYVTGIIYLSKKFNYYIALFFPSAFSILIASFLFPDNTNHFYSIISTIWFSLLFFMTYMSHRVYENINLKNHKLAQSSTKYAEQSKILKTQLDHEIKESQKIKNELVSNNQLLEQKVRERTYALKKINDRLENHQANLAFAHEAADIHSWTWNIEKRTVSISTSNIDAPFQANDIDILLIHPDDLYAYSKAMRLHLKGLNDRFEATYRIKKNNQWCWIQDVGKVIARDPLNHKPLKMVGIHRDIQKEQSDQEQLKLAAIVFEQVEEGIFVLDNNLCFLEVNPYFENLIGFTQEAIFGKHLLDITTQTKNKINKNHMDLIKQLILHGEYDAEVQEEFCSGKKLSLWLHINSVTDDKSQIIHYVGIVTDLTDRKKQEQRLSYLENYDALTDLPNRYYFNLQLHRYVTDNHYSIKKFAIYRINIDRFRSLNEFLSHHAGDDLLKQVAQRLRVHCSDALLISYLNNDDFAIIYNFTNNNNNVRDQADKIFNIFEQPFSINKQEQSITVSIGIATYPEHGRQIDTLNSHAEFALSEAKKLGGHTINYYANQSVQIISNGINLENDLRKAIKNKEFIVYYQPKVCSLSQHIYGFEALIRWNHPELGLISPDVFIPLAEETSLITEIGQFVLFETCRQIRIWKDLGFDHLRVSVNIVAQQIHRGHLIDDIDSALSIHQISGEMLELELTESSLLDKSEHIIQLLEKVKERQISISLDDFGTGYSSLAYLTRYPIDTLKIDQAFISKIGQEKDEAIVNAIIAMGKAIGLTLIAEGVETIKQIEFLKSRGCYILQGFYFSKPLTAKESTNYLIQYKI